MAQVFHRSANTLSRLSIYGFAFFVAALGAVIYFVNKSPYVTDVNVTRDQPVPFSHKHHAGELGIDCRYCHTSVEDSSFAGLPPTATCMSCHSRIWTNAPLLEPVRASYRSDKSIEWTRVNAVPDFVYFNHSIHIKKGIGCTTCHGPVGEMPLTWRANTMQMQWCLGCHREPERYVRPREEIFSVRYEQPSSLRPVSAGGREYPDQMSLGADLVKAYKIKKLTNCSTCHR